jgi:hypothetical protein
MHGQLNVKIQQEIFLSSNIYLYSLLFIGPCIILIVELRQTNLMSLALLFHYLLLNMFRMLVYPSSEACYLFVQLFHVLYYSGSMCVGVTEWFGWGGVVSFCRLKHYSQVTSSWSIFIKYICRYIYLVSLISH